MAAVRVAQIKVQDTIRRLKLDESIWRRAVPQGIMTLTGEVMPAIVEMHTPRKTGRLADSAQVRIWPTKMHVWFEAPYAKYVDEGFPESPGRYVPAPLEKRLTGKGSSRSLTPRGSRIDWTRQGNEVKVNWFEVETKGRGVGRREWKKFEQTVRRKSGVEVITVESLKESAGFWKKMGFERGTEILGKVIMWKELNRDIGMHPGYKGAHFIKAIADDLVEDLRNIIDVVIRREWMK